VGKLDDAPDVEPGSLAAWRRWLRANHDTSDGVWLVLDKTTAPRIRLTVSDAVDEALCWGWIDSLPRKVDDSRWKLWLAPRKPKSVWSKVNKTKLERLLAEGRVQPPGLAAIDRAKANGSWSSIDQAESLEIPEDLARALAAVPGARGHFDAFPPSVRRGILGWISGAKTSTTRNARVQKTATMAGENRRAQFER
jgi:uncharacterized protein YdeI (YjbR/CyaY-like superfamily)